MPPKIITRADADAYFLERGNTAWTDVPEARREGACMAAEDYARASYVCANWEGWIAEPPDPEAPDDVKQALYELAGWDALVSPLKTGISTPEGGVPILRERLGPMETQYAERGQTMSGQEFSRWIDSLLASECHPVRRSGPVKRYVRA